MAALVKETVPHGMKAIRHMRGKTAPSESQKKRVKQTYEYFLEKVDPIIGACITHMLCEQPNDILGSMIDYLSTYEASKENTDKTTLQKHTKPKKELKIYLATSIGPVVAKLVNRVAAVQPANVIEFMCNELSSMQEEDSMNPDMPEPKSSSSSAPKKDAPSSSSPIIALSVVEPKSIQIAIVGLGGSGKSSIINMLTGVFEAKVRPTIGFRPFSMMMGEDKVKFYDLGGGKKIRDIWDQYFHDVHAVIYVMDGTAPLLEVSGGDAEANAAAKEAVQIFQSTMQHAYLKGKPVMILVNKQDQPQAQSLNDVKRALQLDEKLSTKQYMLSECSSFVPENVDEAFTGDARIEGAMEALMQRIVSHYGTIDSKVQLDIKQKAVDEARKRIERERKVLKNKIASAFVHLLSPELVESLSVQEDLESIFNEEEGLTFLAAEIGEEASNLQDIAVDIAQLVGYQRLALQIIGALKAPISKKKVPMDWNSILTLVKELRVELGL